jgi:hypothetical protein
MRNLLVLPLLVAMVGCATTNEEYKMYLEAQKELAEANSRADIAKYKAIETSIKTSTDPTSKAVGMMMLGMMNNNKQTHLAEPPKSEAFMWASIIVPSLTNIASGYFGYALGKASSDNAANVAVSTNQAFMGMGGSIERAGVAGYPFVQAPAANLTYTLSGTGVLGSGSYNGPVTTTNTTNTTTTTTRNCNANSNGTTTPASSANC